MAASAINNVSSRSSEGNELCASAMLAAGMAMRLRKTLRSSQSLRQPRSPNGFCFAHDHAGR
jgi:hypothetical protein